ncbi:MAG TPA: hypothetical protein VFT62_09095 [Mycobacteriales bacterium]|nr:hypothetical protein [Mycobacteriales bacterium]
MTALAVPAAAAGTTPSASATPAKGEAASTLTLLRLELAGTTISAGQVAAITSNATKPHQASVVVTPLDSSVTGPVGRTTVPIGQTATVPAAPRSIALPGGIGSITGPTLRAAADDTTAGPVASAVLKALGKVTLLNVPLDLKAASLSDLSQVTSSAATARKSLELGSLALPSLQDLLSSLGVNLSALLGQLPQDKLVELAGLVTSTASGAVATANSAVDAAQAAITGTVPGTLDQAKSALTAAQGAVTTAQGAVATATSAFNTAFAAIPALTLPLGVSAGLTPDQFLALSSTLQSATDALTSADLVSLATAVKTAEDALTAANAAVDQVQALVTALVNLVTAVLNAVVGDQDPLAALGNIKVLTSAVAAKNPKADAAVSVGSVKVLGAATSLQSLTGVLGDVTGTLSSVLNSVAGVKFTPPALAIGQPSKSTDRKGDTRFAKASIAGVTLTLPTITLPAALALPNVPTALGGSLTLGDLAETAQWTPGTPATTSTPTTTPKTPRHRSSGGPLAETGGRVLLPIVGAVLIGAALAVRRRFHPAA